MPDLRRIFDALLYYFILPFTAVSFVLTPLTNDTRIFLGAAAIADTYYQLPYGLDAAYEVKPIGNRILNWFLYKVADFVVPFASNHYTEFGYFVKLTALVILIVCCWYVSSRVKTPYVFPLMFIGFACGGNFGLLMSEWFAAMFSLVAVALLLEENRGWWQVIAGMLCVGIALLKSITVLMVIPVVCIVYLLGGEIDWKKFIGGYIAAGAAFLIACRTIWPYSLGDMLMSRLVAHVGMYDYTTMLTWFWLTQDRTNLLQVILAYAPIIVAGFVAVVYLLFSSYARGDRKTAVLLSLLWLAPAAIVFIQSEYIIYHYLVFIPSALVSILLIINSAKYPMKTVAIVLILVMV